MADHALQLDDRGLTVAATRLAAHAAELRRSGDADACDRARQIDDLVAEIVCELDDRTSARIVDLDTWRRMRGR